MDNFIPKPRSMKKSIFSIITMAAVAILSQTTSCRNEKIVTFRSLLREMAETETLTRLPDPFYRLVQFSSYDRRSIHPDSAGWFANNDYTHFIREETNEDRREFVMLETDGPGAIVRWWMTFGNENALNSYIRVYIDGQPTPVIEGMAPQLIGEGVLAPAPLSSSVSPLTEPQRRGYNLYLPIPFSGKCRITLENDSIIITPQRRTPSIYYNINTRIYEDGTRVESMNRESASADLLSIASCASDLASIPEEEADKKMRRSLESTLAPGEEISLPVTGEGFAVDCFSLELNATDTSAALKGTSIRMTFDGRQTVEVPAGTFSAQAILSTATGLDLLPLTRQPR